MQALVNVSSDVNPTADDERKHNNDCDYQEDDIFSCLENKIIDKDSSSNVDFALGLRG